MIFIDNFQHLFMNTVYVMVFFATVKHPHNQSVGKLTRGKSIQQDLYLIGRLTDN